MGGRGPRGRAAHDGPLLLRLGDGAEQAARDDLADYYAWLGDYAEQIVASAATDTDTVKGYLAAFEAAGCDEIICFPVSTDPGQVDLLAEAVL